MSESKVQEGTEVFAVDETTRNSELITAVIEFFGNRATPEVRESMIGAWSVVEITLDMRGLSDAEKVVWNFLKSLDRRGGLVDVSEVVEYYSGDPRATCLVDAFSAAMREGDRRG